MSWNWRATLPGVPFPLVWVLFALLWVGPLQAAPRVEAVALMRDAAVLRIDGREHLLRKGEQRGGVRLLASDARAAQVEVEGRRHRLTLSRAITSRYTAPERSEVSIVRNRQLQYHTLAEINGESVRVLVDTGANLVALSRDDARRLGVDIGDGVPIRVSTAGGVRDGWRVTLKSVSVGDIRIPGVPATVVDGSFPSQVLLGMSFLQHVQFSEEDGVLHLRERY